VRHWKAYRNRMMLRLSPLAGMAFVGGCYSTAGFVLERALSPTAFENALTIPFSLLSGLLTFLATQ
jgi:hypothetical protein